MAKIYNVTYKSEYGLDISLGENKLECAPFFNQSFTNMEDAITLFDKILDYLSECINNDIENPMNIRERMNADFYPSLDMYRFIQYGEDESDEIFDELFDITDFAWKYDVVKAREMPNYETVIFELFWKADEGFRTNDPEIIPPHPMATVQISCAPLFESINEFNDFWKSPFDEEAQISKQYREKPFYELISEFDERHNCTFPYDYWAADLADDRGFFEISFSREEFEKYKNNDKD